MIKNRCAINVRNVRNVQYSVMMCNLCSLLAVCDVCGVVVQVSGARDGAMIVPAEETGEEER